jgi:hypothetical protein
VPGETEHHKGRRGALLAKHYLERTTRISAPLVNPDGMAKEKLRLDKANKVSANSVFSFDLGGRFLQGDFEGHDFLAEVKNYKNTSDLGTHWTAFLAHCYRAVAIGHHMADQFFWISFAPHGGHKWDQLASIEEVRKAVISDGVRDVNFAKDEDPATAYSSEIAQMVTQRVWMIILSEPQVKHLSMSKEHYAVVESHIIKSAEEVIDGLD